MLFAKVLSLLILSVGKIKKEKLFSWSFFSYTPHWRALFFREINGQHVQRILHGTTGLCHLKLTGIDLPRILACKLFFLSHFLKKYSNQEFCLSNKPYPEQVHHFQQFFVQGVIMSYWRDFCAKIPISILFFHSIFQFHKDSIKCPEN